MNKNLIYLLILVFISVNVCSADINLLFNDIDEASGLITGRTNPDLLYSHNDSGGKASICLLNTKGEKKGEWLLNNAQNRDWEEIGISTENKKNYIFIGEIGDNQAKYSQCCFYKFEEPLYNPKKPELSIKNIQKINFRYENGPRDAEAFFIDPVSYDIIIISKREPEAGVYKISYPYLTDSVNIAHKITQLPSTWITSTDISKDGTKILVKNYTNIWLYNRIAKEDLKDTFGRKPLELDYKIEPQGEAVCWDKDSKGYFTLSEKAENQNQKLYYYQFPNSGK